MTATLVCSRSASASAARSAPSAAPSATSHRHIKVSSRLAPQIYLGHLCSSSSLTTSSSRSNPTPTSSTSTNPGPGSPHSPDSQDAARPVVVKCAGRLRKDRGPWKEWQAARQLRRVGRSHPNVVQLLDSFVQRSHVFLVMEHCARGDLLADLMATRPHSRLAPARALRIALDLARGLRFLHETCNLAHRDVSLENVFVASDGRCKLGDFGLSTRADAPARGCVGKPQYVAPEVVSQPSYDPVAADVWSLGVLLFMLLTGAPLLQFASPRSSEFEAVRAMGCRGLLESWGLAAQLSADTVDLLGKMLQFNPSQRLQTMADVLAHPALLAAAKEEEEAQAAKR